MTVIDRFDGTEHAFLSNFAISPIAMPLWHPGAGHWASTVEHAFQAAKTEDEDEALKIISCGPPGQAKRLGRKVTLRAGWDEGRDVIMRALLELKFAPGSDLARKLLDTGDAELVEGNTWGDRYWGVCGGRGENRLGKMLVEIRAELLQKAVLR